jgi:Txe/YoeB family toxin of Txe-Axe toxin-antitoxin module
MPLPSLEEIIHSLYQDGNIVEREKNFSDDLGDVWIESWVKDERIYRVDNSDRGNLPIYFPEDMENAGDIAGKNSDTLAFYVSYHYSRDQWGIYLIRSGVLRLAKYLQRKGLGFSESVEVSRNFLIRHELTHFQTDFGITSLELATKTPVYLPFRRRIRSANPGWNVVEEGLANRLGRSEVSSSGKLLNDFLDSSPTGYCDWNTHKPKDEANCWVNILDLDNVVVQGSDTRLIGLNSMIVARKYFKDVPIYEVIDMPRSKPSEYFLGPIANIRETVEFQDDLKKLSKGQPRYRKKWEKTKEKLKNGNLIGGTHLEKLKGTRTPIYSVGLDAEARVALRRDVAWEAIAADHHDPLYDRMNRKFGI